VFKETKEEAHTVIQLVRLVIDGYFVSKGVCRIV